MHRKNFREKYSNLILHKKQIEIKEKPFYANVECKPEYINSWENYKNIIDILKIKLKNKEKIKVGFVFISNVTTNLFWKYLYKEFEKDSRFEPYMIVAPYSYLSKEYLVSTTTAMVELLKKDRFNVISGWDFEKDENIDIKESFKDSIMFFMDPYPHLTDEKFLIKNFKDTCLTYYIPYSYCIVNIGNCTQMDPQNYAYKIYPDTKMHEELILQYSYVKKNVGDFIGYLGSQRLLCKKNRIYKWNLPHKRMKKVIIAPHHLLGLGNFLELHQVYLDIAEKYKDKISFVFKPHPIFKESLLKYWSEDKIQEYFKKWESLPNTKLEFGDYENLFFTSDAMILDSGSFCAEYSLLNKPFLFIEKTPPFGFNPVGEAILEHQYKGSTEKDIYDFIENIVLNNMDPKSKQRKGFIDENLVPRKKNIAREIYKDVINDIEAGIKNDR